jgi:hypothetical protein
VALPEGEPAGVGDDGAPPDDDGPSDSFGDGLATWLGARDALGEGLATWLGATEALGDGRRPTGSGPTNTRAARTPAATRTPARSPARIDTADLIAREGTSPVEAEAASRGRC